MVWPHLSLSPHFLSFHHPHNMELSRDVYFTTPCPSFLCSEFLSPMYILGKCSPTFNTPGKSHLLLCAASSNSFRQNHHSFFVSNYIHVFTAFSPYMAACLSYNFVYTVVPQYLLLIGSRRCNESQTNDEYRDKMFASKCIKQQIQRLSKQLNIKE